MVFNTGAALLDAIVLAVVSKEPEGTYGYKITQDVRGVLDISESTLYPVLRRLQKDDCLEVYDQAYAGRNRRYYKLTEKGQACIEHVKAIAEKMDEIAFTGISPEEKMLLRRILFQICENVEKERNR